MEFENLQIEVPQNDESSPLYGVKVYEKKYKNKKDFVVGFNPNDQEFQDRKNRRAKRFGIKEPTENTEKEQEPLILGEDEAIQDEEKETESIKSLDVNFFKELDLSTLDWPAVPDSALEEMRLDAIHVFGVEHMSTKDIFDYFSLFGPDTLEWIDDYSCNVVWDDEESVVRAMDNMSKTYSTLKKMKNQTEPKPHLRTESPEADDMDTPVSIKVEENNDMTTDSNNLTDVVNVDEDDIDPKDVWRVGYPYKTFQLFLRPATLSDKKMPGAASRSQYYLLYGKKGNGAVSGIVSKSRKRKLEEMKKRANEIFNTKEPDVKIVPLEELRGVSKMEVDEDEPVVKRMNLNVTDQNTMSMVADRVEVATRLGNRYDEDDEGDDDNDRDETTVYDRLGRVDDVADESDDENDRFKRSTNIRDRLGGGGGGEKQIHKRLGTKLDNGTKTTSSSGDARKDIDRLRSKKHGGGSGRSDRGEKNFRSGYRDLGYEDEEEGVYHDIYRADDNTSRDGAVSSNHKKDSKNSRHRQRDDDRILTTSSSSRKRDSSSMASNSVKNRLGKSTMEAVNDRSSSPSGDLRGRLKKKGVDSTSSSTTKSSSGKTLKEEKANEDRLNLCIEIKQEQRDPLEDIDIEMNDMDNVVGDFEF